MKFFLKITLFLILQILSSFNLYANLIVNGNFSQGNIGFTSDYQFANNSGFGQGKYAITDNPQKYHPGFYKCSDHTNDSEKLMMIIDSYSSPNKVVWRQTVDVQENNTYEFRMWATKLVYYEDSYLEIRINGIPLDSIYHVTHSSGTWSKFHRKWFSSNFKTATIEIINLTTASGGNDLAFDDFYFNLLSACQDLVIENAEDVSVCPGEQVSIGNYSNPKYKYNWTPDLFLNNTNTSNPICSPESDIIYYVKVSSSDTCFYYDTINVYLKPDLVNVCDINYDLGDLCPYATKQFDFKINSRSLQENKISQLQFSNQNGIFTFEDNKPLPIIINNGDNLYRINLFALEQRGRHYDTLNIVIKEECENTYQVVFSWNIVDSDTKVWLQDTLVSAGDYICYPIYFESSCKSDQDIFKAYTLELDVNKKLFMPEKVDFGTFSVSRINDEMNRITISGSHNLKNQNGIINHICGKVLLADSINNNVSINSFEFDNYDISTGVIKNGNIKLTQCQFGIRHIDLIKVTNFSISPNISDDYSIINLVSSEVGTFKFEVFDYTGNLVDTFYLNRTNKSDSEELNYDLRLDNKTQGVYFIKLTAPWSTIAKSLIIVK